MAKGWGGVARRGADLVGRPREGTAAEAWQDAIKRAKGDDDRRSAPPAWERDEWVRQPDAPARRPVERLAEPPRRRNVSGQAHKELTAAVGATRAPRFEQRLGEAVRAYDRDRYAEARRILVPLAEAAPGAPAVRELLGLTYYREGRWLDALRELEAFVQITSSFDQHPVLADCHRALGHRGEVGRLWDDLREASPSAELVAEGRIVAAGALGDAGDLAGAIALLERARTDSRSPRLHHLRTWYALADLYERAGDIAHARALFRRIVTADRDFVDAIERLAALD